MGWFTSLLQGQPSDSNVGVIHSSEENTPLLLNQEERQELQDVLFQMQQRHERLRSQVADVDNGLQSLYQTHIDTRKRSLQNERQLQHIDALAQRLRAIEESVDAQEERLDRCESSFNAVRDRIDRLVLHLHTFSQEVNTQAVNTTVALPTYLESTVSALRNAQKPLTYRDIAQRIGKKRQTAMAYVSRLQEYGYSIRRSSNAQGEVTIHLAEEGVSR